MSTDILNIQKRRLDEKKNNDEKVKQAIQVFQDGSIAEIEWTDGLKTIRKYWVDVLWEAVTDLWAYNAIENPGETTKAQEKLDIASKFLYYLDSSLK